MQRRNFIKNTIGLGLAMHPMVKAWSHPLNGRFPLRGEALSTRNQPGTSAWADFTLSGPPKPLFIYNNWSAYDELSDNKPQTEALAMRELREIVRLKTKGVEIDYYVMDAFWFALWGGYRTWKKEHWPNGPDGWLEACKQNNIKPGMWLSLIHI